MAGQNEPRPRFRIGNGGGAFCCSERVGAGRLAGEVRDDGAGIAQPEHREDRVRRVTVLAPDDRVLQAQLLGCHAVGKDSLAAQAQPCIVRAGNGQLHIGVDLHVPIDVLGRVRAEPELAVERAGKHERAALRPAVPADRGQILYGVRLQKCYDFVHEKDLLMRENGIYGCIPALTGL